MLASVKCMLCTSRPGTKWGWVAGPPGGGLSAGLAPPAGSACPFLATGPGYCSSSERLSTLPRVSLTSSSPGEGITEKQVPAGPDLNINVPPETTGHPKDTGFAKVPPYEPQSIYKHSLSVFGSGLRCRNDSEMVLKLRASGGMMSLPQRQQEICQATGVTAEGGTDCQERAKTRKPSWRS